MAIIPNEDEVVIGEIHGGGMKVKIYEQKADQMGGMDKKTRIVGRFIDRDGYESGVDIPMVIKEVKLNDEYFGGEREEMGLAQRYYERWKFLKEMGVPVVPNVVVLDGNRVLMPDMKANGGDFFGKEKNDSTFLDTAKKKRKLTNAEEIFMNTDVGLILSEVVRVRDRLRGIRLPWDDPCDPYISPLGENEFGMVLDIAGLEHGNYYAGGLNTDDPIERVRDKLFSIRKNLESIRISVE